MPPLPPFQQLLDRHAEGVLGYLLAMVGPVEAEDCFQETFMAALRAYPELRDGSNLRGWIFTIAHRKALDSERQRRRRPTPAGRSDELAELEASISGAVARGDGELAYDGELAPDWVAVGSGLPPDELWQAVEALPPKQRAAVTLRFAADLSHREIAAAIECSEAAARRNVHEGLNRLREVWR